MAISRQLIARRGTLLPFSPPCIGAAEIADVVSTLESGWLTTGPKTALFEQAFKEFIGAPEALALNSCTAAMHTALVDLGVGPVMKSSPAR